MQKIKMETSVQMICTMTARLKSFCNQCERTLSGMVIVTVRDEKSQKDSETHEAEHRRLFAKINLLFAQAATANLA